MSRIDAHPLVFAAMEAAAAGATVALICWEVPGGGIEVRTLPGNSAIVRGGFIGKLCEMDAEPEAPEQ